jgi:hypothetical protein
MGPAGALARGRWIWHVERVLHLPSETGLQRSALSLQVHYITIS